VSKLLFVAIGGAIGSILRYAVSGMTSRYFEGSFPWGTLSVNLIGAIVIGFLWGIFEGASILSNLRSFVFIGIIGSFTTFSTYSLETFYLLRNGELKLALTNILITNILSIALVLMGFAISKYLIVFLGTR